MKKSSPFFFSGLALLGLAIYSNTFFSPFHFDDNLSIVDNPLIRRIFDPGAIWSFWPTRFITTASFALNYHFHQLHVPGYHVFNLAIHLGSAMLVWRLGLLTFSTPALKDQPIARHAGTLSFLAGLVFLSHPIQTQAVTYIVQRAASLATFFYLASLCLYAKSRLLGVRGVDPGPSKFYYAGALIAAVAAMFTKENAITLPFMIGLYEFSFLDHQKGSRKKYLLPFFMTLAIIPLTMFFTRSANIGEMRRAGEPLPDTSSLSYFITQGRVVVTYVRLALFPVNQNIDYDYPVAHSFFQIPTLASFICLIGLVVAGARLFRKYRLVSFGIFWFFLALAPESSFIPIRDVIFEHRLYLPMAGFSLFLPSALFYIFKEKSFKTMVVVLFIVIAGYSVLAYARNAAWKSDLALWNDAVLKSPHKARPYNNRGLAYADNGDADKAIADFTKALELKTDFVEAYNNRGSVYLGQGDLGQAIVDYDSAVAHGPRYAEAYHNRGLAYANKGDLGRAFLDYDQALEIRPDYAEAYYDRGNAYYRKGDLNSAIKDYNKAIEIKPDYAEAYNNRGSACYGLGDLGRAILDYDAAIAIKPDYAEARANKAAAAKAKK